MNFKLCSIFFIASLFVPKVMAGEIPDIVAAVMLCVAQDERYKQNLSDQSVKTDIEGLLSEWPEESLNCFRKLKPLSVKLCEEVVTVNLLEENGDRARLQKIEEKFREEFQKFSAKNASCLNF